MTMNPFKIPYPSISYLEKLNKWFEDERAAGRVLDISFFPGTNRDCLIEDAAKSVYETVTSDNGIDITDEVI